MFGNRRRWMAALYLIVAGGVCLTGTCGRCLGQAAAGDYEDASGGSPEAVARAPVLPVDIERIVWWLPEDTESLLVSRGKVPNHPLHYRRSGKRSLSGPGCPGLYASLFRALSSFHQCNAQPVYQAGIWRCSGGLVRESGEVGRSGSSGDLQHSGVS